MKRPTYRGALCHGGLAAISADPTHGPAVLAAVEPRHIAAIRSASKLAWIDAEALDGLNAAYLRIAGRDGYIDFWRRYAIGSVDTTLFGALFVGALRIFGRSPAGMLKWVGRAWEVTTRDYGRVEVDVEHDVVRIRLLDLPEGSRHVTVPLCTKASVMGVIEFTGHVPDVECDLGQLEEFGRYEVTARWSAADDD